MECLRRALNLIPDANAGLLAGIVLDKTHPCYSDVEWIYEVTGEKPTE